MKKFLFAVLFLGILSLAYLRWQGTRNGLDGTPSGASPAGVSFDEAGFVDTLAEPEGLMPAAPFVMRDQTVVIELSEYAGYAGLLLANGGAKASEESVFFKKHGFKVEVVLTEEESWSQLNSGKVAAAASTVDVLAVYAPKLQVSVPLQLAYSRGADGIVTHDSVRRINDLIGKTLVASQFSESDFFLRYLCMEAEVPVKALAPGERANPKAVNLRYAEDPFVAGDAFVSNAQALAGFVGWEPKVSEVIEAVPGTRVLVSNRNLLVIADILMVNQAFAREHPEMVQAIVEETLRANAAIREHDSLAFPVLASTFGWTAEQSKAELAKVHLSNWPENQAFFSAAVDAAGSFSGIYQTSLFAYADYLKHSIGPDRFIDKQALDALQTAFSTQLADIRPIRAPRAESVETDPLLSRNIRFYFEPNSDQLQEDEQNQAYYRDIVKMLQVSPGSTVLLRGHVDNSRVEEFLKMGGESFARKQALGAIDLSGRRAEAVRKQLVEGYQVDPKRIEIVGRGWEEPLESFDISRRVEVYWFTLE
jgi:NitT/TauT family transport system substrate-binding protein